MRQRGALGLVTIDVENTQQNVQHSDGLLARRCALEPAARHLDESLSRGDRGAGLRLPQRPPVEIFAASVYRTTPSRMGQRRLLVCFILEKDGVPIAALMEVDEFEDDLELRTTWAS